MLYLKDILSLDYQIQSTCNKGYNCHNKASHGFIPKASFGKFMCWVREILHKYDSDPIITDKNPISTPPAITPSPSDDNKSKNRS